MAATVAGAFAVVILVILTWWSLRRQTRVDIKREETSPEGDYHTSSMIQPHHHYMPYVGVFQSSRKQRDEIPPEPSKAEETSEGHVIVSRAPSPPPQEPLILQENSVPLPAYETYMDAPLVTFRPSGTRRPQGIDSINGPKDAGTWSQCIWRGD